METVETIYNVNKADIGFIKFLFEGYDGIAVVSTVSKEKDHIAIYTAPGCEDEVNGLVASLSEILKIDALVKKSIDG